MNVLNRLKFARDLYLSTILVVGIVVMMAYLSTQHFVRYDLTDGRQYAIAEVSKRIMGDLDDIVTVQVYFSEQLPPNLIATRLYVEDILDELGSYAHGNLQVRFLSPDQEATAQEALQLGIPMIRMNILEKDKYEVKNGFLGVAVLYAGNHEVIPVVQDTVNLEYDIVSSINKLVSEQQKTVGFLTGHDEYEASALSSGDSFNQYGVVYAALKKNYDVVNVDLDDEGLSHVDTLVIAGPKRDFTRSELVKIDQFIVQGGNLVALLEPLVVDEAFEVEENNINLEDLIEYYGVKTRSEFVLDQSNETASFAQGYINFVVDYPFWVKAKKDTFETHPILSKVDSVVFPWVTPLDIVSTYGQPLVYSSTEAWLQEAPFNLDPNIEAEDDAEFNQHHLVALVNGPFSSFYRRPGLPVDSNKGEGRLFVIGNARFLSDRSLGQFKQNLSFFLNAIDYLTLDESLISIRSKAANDRPLKSLEDTERQMVKWGGTFLVPLLIILYGILRASLRKRNQRQ